MGKIFLLMGKSSSGKDTIYRELMRKKDIGLKKVVSYTTRPMREGETDGVQYLFKNEEEYRKLKDDKKIIEERTYHTTRRMQTSWPHSTSLRAFSRTMFATFT